MQPQDEDLALWMRLTDKQRACLDLLLLRKTSKQIARILEIAKPTVDQRITAARMILGAADRDETALAYARLKAAYDRVIYDPVDLPPGPGLVPSNFPDGDPAAFFKLGDTQSQGVEKEAGYRGGFPSSGDLWRHDLGSRQRVAMIAAMLVALVIVLAAGLAIAQALSRLLSG